MVCRNDSPLSRTDPSGAFDVGGALADALTTGVGKHITEGVVGFGNAASFGLAARVAEFFSPGVSCTIDSSSGWYIGGEVTGAVASTVSTGGTSAAARGAAEAEFLGLRAVDSWADPGALVKCFVKHRSDFGVSSAEEYAAAASRFFQQGLKGGTPMKMDASGNMRMYDSATNTFGSYNPAGQTRTFFKLTSPSCWDRQPGVEFP